MLARCGLFALLIALVCPVWAQSSGRLVADPASGCKLFWAAYPSSQLDAARWKGQCRQGLAQGPGTFEVRGTFNKRAMVLSGEGTFVDGKLEGRAYWTSNEGWRWEADLHDGLLNGRVFFRDTAGSATDRQYRAGMAEGRATDHLVFGDGDIAGMTDDFEGDYKDGLRNGPGRVVEGYPGCTAQIRYEGEFGNSTFTGRGTLKGPDGRAYTGTWALNSLSGGSEGGEVSLSIVQAQLRKICRKP